MGVTELVFELQALKAKIKVSFSSHIVAMVTYCATKLTATCVPMIGQFVDTMMKLNSEMLTVRLG